MNEIEALKENNLRLRQERDSWRRVAERLEHEKRSAGMILVPRELSIKQKAPGVSAYVKIAGECRPTALAAAWTAICDHFAAGKKDGAET